MWIILPLIFSLQIKNIETWLLFIPNTVNKFIKPRNFMWLWNNKLKKYVGSKTDTTSASRTYLIQIDPEYDSFSSVRVQTRGLDSLVVNPEVGGGQKPVGAPGLLQLQWRKILEIIWNKKQGRLCLCVAITSSLLYFKM